MEEKIIERYEPNLKIGLTDNQINKRIEEDLINHDTSVPTKSIKRILFENFFTLFNMLNLIFATIIFCVGSTKNSLFLIIVIVNTAISTFQEIRSKRVIDKLSIMASTKVKAIRNGKKQELHVNDIVLDDLIELSTGNQVMTDSIIKQGSILVNESYITGEPDSISKNVGDTILSGSYIVSGKCIAQVEHIGNDNYTAQISSGAKVIKNTKSEIMTSLNKIIKFLTFAIIPIGAALFFTQIQLEDNTLQEAVIQTVAALIGMIPEGLVLLTSTVLAVSVTRLSRNKVLVQDLYCIETLARVDTLCLDKTGTITEGTMEVKDFILADNNIENYDITQMENILSNISKFSEDENATIMAIKDKFCNIKKEFKPLKKVPFSSETKWSGISFENVGTVIIGAPEFVLKDDFKKYKKEIEKYSKDFRVLVLVHSKNSFDEKNNLPDDINLIGYIFILDKIRKEAGNTIKYFYNQNVDIKIISGDNPITVSKIAKNVGIKNWNKYFDMSTLDYNSKINEIATKYTIFGRVTPTQKKNLIKALQENKKTVAMTGDGVNDVLALKESDCSIAMANGSDATKNISKIVLLDSNFASMPKIVAEGRRTINNIQRSASLFLVKTIYSSLLALIFIFMRENYPFIPIQLSLISAITIGIPSFMLALEPNKERIKGDFLKNVISKALPTGLTAVINIFSLTILNKYGYIPEEQFSSLCVISTGICGLMLLFSYIKSRKSEDTKLPFSIYRLVLALTMTILFFIGLIVFGWFYNIVPLDTILYIIIRILIVSAINFIMLTWIFKNL